MTNEEILQRQVNAMTTGFTTTLALKGYDENMMKNAAVLYSDPQHGMLRSRMNAREQVKGVILEKFASIRQRIQAAQTVQAAQAQA